MATGTVPSTVLPPPPPATDEQREHERIIHRQLDRTRLYVRLVDLTGSLIGLAIGVIGFLLVVALIDHWVVGLGFAGRTIAALLLIGAVLWYLVVQVVPLLIKSINPTYAARTIEEATPTLKNSLVNFLLLRQDRSHVREVVYQAVEAKAATDIANVPVEATIDRSRLIRAGYVLCGVMALLAAYKILSPKDPFQTAARVILPWAEIARPSRVTIVDVKPGDSEVYFGDVALVSAEVRGVREGDPVNLLLTTADGQTVDRPIPMSPLPGGLRFECTVPPQDELSRGGLDGMQQDVTYRIVAGDAETSTYKLSVVTAPTIVVERLEYQYPAYTKKEPLAGSGQGDIQALEGTKVIVHATANQPIKSAWIEFDPHVSGRPPEMIRLATEGTRAWGAVVLELKEDRQTPWHETYQVRFYNERGHQNEEPSLHRLEVIRDLPPEVQILAPAKPRIEVPEDGTVQIEVRGVDPDFGLSKLQLRGAAGEKRVELDLIPPDAGQPPQLTVPYVFRPRDHRLVAGDELTYMAQAEDNRVNASTGQPEPNVARSREYVLVVTGPDSPPDPNQTPPQQGQNPDQDQNPNNVDPGNQAQQPPNQQPGESQTSPDTGIQQPPQGGNPPPMPGQSPMPGEPKPQDANPLEGQPPNAQPMNSQPMDGQPMNAPPMGAEPMTGEPMPGGQQGEGNPAGGNPGGSGQQPPGQGDPMAGGQSGGQSGNQSADGPAGQNSAGQSQPGQSQAGQNQPGQNQPGAGQPGQANQNQPGQGQSASQPNGDSQQGGQPGNPGAAGNQPQTGQNASSGNPAGGQTPDNAPGTQNAEGSGQPTGDETGDGASGAGPQGKAHDGQAIDQILKKYQELQEKLREAQSGGTNNAQGQQQGESAQESGGEQPAGEPGAAGEGAQPNPNGPRGSENPEPMGQQPGTSASPQDPSQEGANAATGRAPGQPGQPANEPGEKQPGEAEAGPTSEESTGTEQNIEQGAGKLPDENQSTEQPEKSTSGGSGGKPMGPNKTGREQPMTDETQPKGSTAEHQGGAGQNGEAGAGDKSEEKSGSGPGQEQNRDRPKEQQGGNDASQQNDPSGVSNSKKQSDSSGGESGDRSGGGKKGPGQSAGQAGNDSAGRNSAGDQGAGKANERGSGETGERAGTDQESSGKTGQAGNRSGQGSQTKANPMGDKTGRSEPGPQDATGGQPGERSDDQRPGEPSERRGQQPGGSTPAGGGGGDSSPPETPGGEAAAADEANLEYARKATELALQKLSELDQNPDPELLDRLGWSKEDLAEFLNRWNSLKQSAEETVEGQRELDEALRSLGLRDPALRRRAGGTATDNQRDLRDSGGRSAPPSKYRDLFESFRKGAARSP